MKRSFKFAALGFSAFSLLIVGGIFFLGPLRPIQIGNMIFIVGRDPCVDHRIVPSAGATSFANAFDADRASATRTIADAIQRFHTERTGWPAAIPMNPTQICRSEIQDCSDLVDLKTLVSTGYLPGIPEDPLLYPSNQWRLEAGEDPRSTLFAINLNADDTVTVTALYVHCDGPPIGITR